MMHLLRKELGELLNKQMILSLVVTFLLIAMIGFVMTNTMNQSLSESGLIHILDRDDSAASAQLAEDLEERGYTVERVAVTGEPDYAALLEEQGWKEAAVLPENFGEALGQGEACEIGSAVLLQTTSAVSLSMNAAGSAQASRHRG